MLYLRYVLFSCFLLSAGPVFSQVKISGTVVDAQTAEPLPHVNIGIKNKNIGTASRENGSFSIALPKKYSNDTLTFSLVGHQESQFPIKYLVAENPTTIKLTESVTTLSHVEINAERLVERKFGIKRRNLLMHFSDGMFQETDVFEIGQLIKFKDIKAQITSVNLYLFDSERDSVTFRINFYMVEDGRPSERLIEKSIVQKHPVEQGWLRLDIASENIILKDDFVVSLEFIPDEDGQNKKVFYEVKLGGSSRSFYRKNSLGTWNTPPHHYCMYVTALVDKSTPKEPEELETLPAISLWSEAVKDSFDIFIKLPAGYKKQKRQNYPVIYCLDANAYFDHINHIVEEFSKKNVLDIEPIIVGIGYANAYFMDSLRVRDYTFPKAPPSGSLPISGGGNRFHKFIKTELLPFIDKNYRTDPARRTIMGHSFGGYFVGFAMLHDFTGSPIFKNYVAASPSLWYHDGYLIEQFEALPSLKTTAHNPRLFLSSGEEELKFDVDHNFQRFTATMSNLRTGQFESKIYPDLDHLGTAIPSFEDAIKLLFGHPKIKK